ncbi:MAG: ABC transporter permease [Actinomycetota bacterium]
MSAEEDAGARTRSGFRFTDARAPWSLVAGAAAVSLLFAAPFAYLLARNAGAAGDLWSTLAARDAIDPLLRSLALAAAVATSSSIVGTGVAWVLARTDVPLRRVWAALTPLPLVFPSFVGAFALQASLARGGLLETWFGVGGFRVEGFVGAWAVLTLFTFPYVLLPVAARLLALPPSYEESARLLGRSPLAVFRTVVLPQLADAIRAGALLVFLYVISDFGAVQLLRYDTLTRVIYENRLLDRSRSLALALLLAVIALVVATGERRMVKRAPAATVARARTSLRMPLGRWRWPTAALMAAVVVVSLVGPLLSLAFWAWRGIDGAADPGSYLRDQLGDLAGPAQSTAWVSVVTAVVAVTVVLPVAYLTARHRSRLAAPANALVVSGFALPGLVIALSVIALTTSGSGTLFALYRTYPLLVLAYVVHFGAQSMRSAQVALGSVPARLDDAARMLGAGRVRRLATIDLPLMLPGLAAGGGLVLLSTMKELPATLLLSPFGFETLATRMWGATEDGFLAEAGLASIVLVAVSGILTWALVVRRADRVA